MKKDKLMGYVEMAGETLVVTGAAAWLPLRSLAMIIFAAGTVLMAIGRFAQTPSYQKYSPIDPKVLTLRRLYRQRMMGMVALILSAIIMNMPQGFHFGLYVAPASWLVTFTIFAIIEVYTAFRISAVEKDNKEIK